MGAADDPSDQLPKPDQEARARHLFEQYRCVVCQNESIDDSDADIAQDIRRIIRGQVAAGRSDAQIKAFLVDRYGEFILLKPRFSAGNAMLWLTPVLILVAGGAFLALRGRRPGQIEAELTAEEEARLKALVLDGEDDTVRPNKGQTNSLGMTET